MCNPFLSPEQVDFPTTLINWIYVRVVLKNSVAQLQTMKSSRGGASLFFPKVVELLSQRTLACQASALKTVIVVTVVTKGIQVFFFIFDEPSMQHGGNFSHRCVAATECRQQLYKIV